MMMKSSLLLVNSVVMTFCMSLNHFIIAQIHPRQDLLKDGLPWNFCFKEGLYEQ